MPNGAQPLVNPLDLPRFSLVGAPPISRMQEDGRRGRDALSNSASRIVQPDRESTMVDLASTLIRTCRPFHKVSKPDIVSIGRQAHLGGCDFELIPWFRLMELSRVGSQGSLG